MVDIKIYKDANELDSTAYMEMLAGPYAGECWVKGSLFFDEETFGFFEHIIKKHVPKYDHYEFTEIGIDSWSLICDDLRSLTNLLRTSKGVNDIEGHVGFVFRGTKEEFENDFQVATLMLSDVIDEMIIWLEVTLRNHKSVTVLGM